MDAPGLYTLAEKNNIGDTSVFIFNDLPESEQAPWIAAARQREREPRQFAATIGDE